MRHIILILLACAGFQAAATPSEQACIAKQTEIAKKITCLENVTDAMEMPPGPGGRHQFKIQFTQPIDHDNSSAGTFSQALVLLHIGENEPMVLETSGYNIFGVYLTEATDMFGTNQLQVEHRYFARSIPAAPVDWTKLNIKQSADDFHAITVAFKQIYAKNWINNGGSKGGMTSLYHHRFYPGDVQGTLADVSPLSFSVQDQRYPQFLTVVGGAKYKGCRSGYMDMQRLLLKNRATLAPKLTGDFSTLGGKDQAFEAAVADSLFTFWQYGDPETLCPKIATTPEKAYDLLQQVNSTNDYTDGELANFLAYDYQSATQLGGPDNLTAQIQDLMLYPNYNDEVGTIPHTYSNAAMLDIDQWARTSADHIIYIYGEFDPWTAGAFPLSETGKETFKYIAHGGNHGSAYTDLAKTPKAEAIKTLSRWFGKDPVTKMESVGPQLPYLSQIEMREKRRLRLP